MANLAARHERLAGAIELAVTEVLRSGTYVGGPVVAEAERRISHSMGYGMGVGVGSGTDALALSLRALGVGAGDRVAVPALSFFATAEAVCQVGATPVFVDVQKEAPLLDLDSLGEQDAISAVILVHLFGARCPAPTGLPVISDAAQAIGWGHGRPAGTMAALSFYPSKTLGAAGEGGMVLTDDGDLAESVRRLGNHGATGPHRHIRERGGVGTNSRLDALQAAILLAQIDDLENRVQRRRAIASRYEEALTELRPLPRAPEDAVHQFLLRSPERTEILQRLAESSIGAAIYYPLPMDAQPFFTGKPNPQPSDSRCPHAARFSTEAFAIPCHAELCEADVELIIEVLKGGSP